MKLILELIILVYIVYTCCDGFLKKTGWTDAAERKEVLKAISISAALKK